MPLPLTDPTHPGLEDALLLPAPARSISVSSRRNSKKLRHSRRQAPAHSAQSLVLLFTSRPWTRRPMEVRGDFSACGMTLPVMMPLSPAGVRNPCRDLDMQTHFASHVHLRARSAAFPK